MIIIFEGHDGSGKTEIAQELSRVLKIPYFKNKSEKALLFNADSSMTAYAGILLSKFLVQTKMSVILDRFWLSELVYSAVLKRCTNDLFVGITRDFMTMAGAKTIVCYKTEGFFDDVLSVDEIRNIKKEYDKYKKCSNFFFLDTTDRDLDSQIKKIIKFLEVEI